MRGFMPTAQAKCHRVASEVELVNDGRSVLLHFSKETSAERVYAMANNTTIEWTDTTWNPVIGRFDGQREREGRLRSMREMASRMLRMRSPQQRGAVLGTMAATDKENGD